MSKETVRRGKAAPRRDDERGSARVATPAGADASVAKGRDTGQLPPETSALAGISGPTAPLAERGDPAQTLVLAGIAVPGREATVELEGRAQRRNRRLLILALLASLLLLVLVFLSMSPLTDPVSGVPPRAPHPIALAEVQPYGVNTFLHKEVDSWKKEQTLDLARQMGAGWIKQQFPWAEIEFRENPSDPFWDVKNNQSAWDKFDGIVSLAEQNGLRVIARIDTVPSWARPTDPALVAKLAAEGLDPAKSPPLGPHLDDFRAFISTFVDRYRGRITAIQVWNEPNLKGEWATGRPVNPVEYVELLEAAYTAAKATDPNIVILAAPLATNNETLAYAGNLNEVDYLQGMYEVGAARWFDAMAANAYGTIYAPDDPPSPERLNFRRVELLRGVMERNGDDKKAVWFNEYGWNASPADMPEAQLRWGRVSEEQQGKYTVQGIEYARANWPWAGVFTIWYLRQVGDIPRTNSEYFFGLVNPEFVESPAYRMIQARAAGNQWANPGTWGLLSSPIEAGPRWQLRLDANTPTGSYVVPTAPGDTLNIPFTGTDLRLRLVPAQPRGVVTDTVQARYYVTVDGSLALVSSSLPRDEQGRAYIDTGSAQPSEVIIAERLGEQFSTGRHVAQIRVDATDSAGQGSTGGGNRVYTPKKQRLDLPGISAVLVEANRSYLLFGVFSAGLLGFVVVILWRLRRLGEVG